LNKKPSEQSGGFVFILGALTKYKAPKINADDFKIPSGILFLRVTGIIFFTFEH